MIRRTLRILNVAALVILLGSMVASQFRVTYFYAGHFSFMVGQSGCSFAYAAEDFGWDITSAEEDAPGVQQWLVRPRIERWVPFGMTTPATFLDIPWWLVVLACGLLSLCTWRLTRQPKERPAFPVEMSSSSNVQRQPESRS
jgi:hypothetical protein